MQGLTFDNLSSIPRRNHILFLSDYLQEQHSYSERYASEGLTTFSSWNSTATTAPETSLAEPQISTALEEFLLGTPVLKARVPAVPLIERSSTILKRLDSAGGSKLAAINDDQASCKSTTRDGIQIKEKLPDVSVAQHNSKRVVVEKRFGRKENPEENRKGTENERGSSDEDLKRLQERRERKRLKKNIMKSPAKKSEKENTVRCIQKKGNNCRKDKSSAFALMHGFTATNVGKSRITLEPLQNVGFFKKGKASYALKTGQVIKKKRRDHDICFSEARFFERAKAKSNKHIDTKSSSASSSSSGKVQKRKITVKHNEMLERSKEIDKIDEDSEENLDCGDIAEKKEASAKDGHRPYDPANSIIWDIERESYVEESEAICSQETTVLRFPDNVRSHATRKRPDTTVETPVADADVPNGADDTFQNSEDSVHPSQSASQSKVQEMGNLEQHIFSKYFPREDIAMTDTDKSQRRGVYEGHRFITQDVSATRQEEKPKKSPICEPPPQIEASPTLSQMISVDEFPRSYDAFSLADVRSIVEGTKMELDDYCVFDGPGAPEESDLWSRSNTENLKFEPGLHSVQHCMLEIPDSSFYSGHFMEHSIDFQDPLMFQADSGYCCLPGQDLHMEGRDDAALFDWNVENEPFSAGVDVQHEVVSEIDTFSTDAASLSTTVDVSCEDFSGHFNQGRILLYGLDHGIARVSDAEAEVAKLLNQNHWLPRRL